MKPQLISIFTFILSLGIMSGSFAQETTRADFVSALQLNNTQSLNGKYIHAVYGLQRAGFIGISPVPNLVVKSLQAQKVQTNQVTFPSLSIDKEPFKGSYNVVVFVVSEQPTIQWVNPDQGASFQYQYLSKIEKAAIDAFISAQGQSAVFGISL